MNGFDIAVLVVVALSTVLAFVRGVVRELIALASWVLGIAVALLFADSVAGAFAWLDVTPAIRHALAFALIFVAVLVAGALVAWVLSRIVQAAGLSFADRFLGGAFGVARGALLAVLFALVAGVTALPQQDWWQNASVARPLALAALSLKPWLPQAWADRLDFSATGRAPAKSGGQTAGLPFGEARTCVAS
jgi:membrane protein required for colicin V production